MTDQAEQKALLKEITDKIASQHWLSLGEKIGLDIIILTVWEECRQKALREVGEQLECKLMLRDGITISGKTLTEVITRFAESLKKGELPNEDKYN